MKTVYLGIVSALILASVLAGCGGGGASSSIIGVANVSLTDGPGDDYDHVWITVKAISFHTDPNMVWNGNDATWKTVTLPAPVTLDLANLTNGALNQVFAAMTLPVGSYKQIRLFLAGFDDPLTVSAGANALVYNDQVDYTDTAAPYAVHHVPLEIAYPTQGIQLNGNFNVATGSILNLALDFDLEHDLVRFKHGSEFYFTMKPNLRYFDLNQSGAITGYIDPTHLCATTASVSCEYSLIVKAEILSADGSRHFDTRATTVNKSNGSFVLYPLPSGASYDVMIRGRNIETMLIKGVTAPAGSTPASGAAVLSTAQIPIPLTLNSSEYFANFSSQLSPTAGYAVFQQTLPSVGGVTEVPYEVRWRNTNPFTGLLEGDVALASGPLHVANYYAGTALAFSSVSPQEGNGGYSVVTRGLPLAYYNLSLPLSLPLQPPTTTVLLTTPQPVLSSSVVAGTVSGTITQTIPGTYDKGYLVLSRFANIVNTQDISATLVANTGTYSVTLPAGTASAPVPGAYYYGYLRVWNSLNPVTTKKIIPITSMIDLRNNNTASGINISLL